MYGRIAADGAGGDPRIVADYAGGQQYVLCDGAGGRPKNIIIASVDLGDILDE